MTGLSNYDGADDPLSAHDRDLYAHPALNGDFGVLSPLVFGVCNSFAWAVANQAVYVRVLTGGMVSKIGYHVNAQSGNISLGVYQHTGRGRLAVPSTRIATSGTIACPPAGYQEATLDVPVWVDAGDFLALSCDNISARFYGISGTAGNLFRGLYLQQATAHPLPTTGGGTATQAGVPALVGVE